MHSPRICLLAVPVLALTGLLAPHLCAAANSFDEFTYVTFTAPVEIPGQSLPAGTYLFQTADIWSNCDTVQIYTADKGRLLATVMTIPVYRFEPTPERTIVTFEERPANSPEALREWFPRGLHFGHRFIYGRRAKSVQQEKLRSRP